ncbi:MAG: phenylalanine--tRNA ligase subunit beta [Candidatus Pacebacteria bacterium]|nr:phenylalanine--tRNA ligase subunit beta [Candidatus Paceibacterota bacterium]
MKISYNWLQEYFEEQLPSAAELEQIFMMHALEVDEVVEIEVGTGADKKKDWIIDLDVLPNRAHDCLGHRGVAKELATLLSLKLKKDELRSPSSKSLENPISKLLKVEVKDTEWCPRYTAALVRGVKVADSPQWLKDKLEALGQKSINNVVDITNYVMFGIGQPTHIFDISKLKNSNGVKIGVREANNEESIITLGGDQYKLDDSVAVITDANTDTPIAIAGIKGGEVAEVDAVTVDIVVESAKFHPIKTRRASAKIKLRTDAVQRFENETPIELALCGVVEVARLIVEVAGGEIEGFVDTNNTIPKNHKITISMMGLNNFLGSKITINEAEDIIKRFGWEYEVKEEELTVVPPFERLDVRIIEDVYEEIGRVYGFGNIIVEPLPENEPEKFINKEMAYAELVRGIMMAEGITETMTYTLCDKGDIKLASILSADKDYVRANLSRGISKALDKAVKDAPLLGEYDMIKVFEIGRVFTTNTEYTSVAVGLRALGKKNTEQRQNELLRHIQNILETALGVELADMVLSDGILEFNLTKTFVELPVPLKYPSLPIIAGGLRYKIMSQYPFVTRDIAVWVLEGTGETEIVGVIYKHGGELVQRVDKFDEFTKGGKVSLAFHIVFQSIEKTLTDDEVGEIMTKIEAELGNKSGLKVR